MADKGWVFRATIFTWILCLFLIVTFAFWNVCSVVIWLIYCKKCEALDCSEVTTHILGKLTWGKMLFCVTKDIAAALSICLCFLGICGWAEPRKAGCKILFLILIFFFTLRHTQVQKWHFCVIKRILILLCLLQFLGTMLGMFNSFNSICKDSDTLDQFIFQLFELFLNWLPYFLGYSWNFALSSSLMKLEALFEVDNLTGLMCLFTRVHEFLCFFTFYKTICGRLSFAI